MIDIMKGYLQVASGITQVTSQKALEVARQMLAGTAAAGVVPVASARVDALTAQATALAEEMLAASRQNRALLLDLVRTEVEAVVSRLGVGGTAELEAALAASRARVQELERELAGQRRAKAPARPPRPVVPGAPSAAVKKAAVKKAAVKKAAAKKAAASRAPGE